MSGAIVFDLDGTLIDSAPDLHQAANRMLADAGAAPVTLAEVRSFIGHGIPHLVTQAMAARALPEARFAELNAAMLAHYTANPADLTRPYDGVPEALEGLRAAGFRLGLCTNKWRAPTMQILEALDLAQLFEVVVGGDSLPQKKPDPAPLRAAFAALDAPPLLYVGDSEVDAETAARAGLPFALFTRGYRKAPVAALPHAFAFDDWAGFGAQLRALAA